MSLSRWQRDRFAPRIVGVVHLRALPGSAMGSTVERLPAVLDLAKRDAASYAQGGVDAVIVENFGDVPFARGAVEPHVIAAMACITDTLARESGLPIGVNVLRNDVIGAVSIAAMTRARFVRANVYVGAAITDQGLIQGDAERVQGLIRRLGADVDIWADIDVKHAAQLAPRPIADLAEDAVERGLAAAVIVTGTSTGKMVAGADLAAVRGAVRHGLVVVGSGVTLGNIGDTLCHADGVIVGTAMKVDGVVTNPVDLERVRALVDAARSA